jgi:hypothetical protein
VTTVSSTFAVAVGGNTATETNVMTVRPARDRKQRLVSH